MEKRLTCSVCVHSLVASFWDPSYWSQPCGFLIPSLYHRTQHPHFLSYQGLEGCYAVNHKQTFTTHERGGWAYLTCVYTSALYKKRVGVLSQQDLHPYINSTVFPTKKQKLHGGLHYWSTCNFVELLSLKCHTTNSGDAISYSAHLWNGAPCHNSILLLDLFE